MSTNGISYIEVIATFIPGTVLWASSHPSCTTTDGLSEYEHYCYEVVVTDKGTIVLNTKPQVPIAFFLDQEDEYVFFQDYEMALYWKYLTTKRFVDSLELLSLDNKTTNVYNRYYMDLKNRNIMEFVDMFESKNPDKVVEIHFMDGE